MSRFDPGKDWWDEELHKMSIELNKNVVRLELPEIDPAAKIMKDELWMTAKDLRIDVNGAVSAENNIDDGVEAVPACEVNLQQIQDSVDRSFVMLRHMHEAIDDLTRIITHRDVILRNTMDKWRNELDGTLSSVGKLRRSAFYQGTRVINVWKCYLAETKSELRGKRERQLMEALRKCRNIRAQCAHQSSFQYERQAREVATAFQRWHMEHHQLWSQLSSQVCSAFLQLPRIKKQHMLQLNKLTYNQYVLEERRKENAVVMTSQKREKINLSSTLASLKAAYTKTITEGKVIEYERLQGAIARLNDKLYETRMKRSQFAEKSQAEICQIIASRHRHIIANLERVQAVMGEIAELTGINDFMDDPNDIPTIMARLNEGMLSLDFQMPKLESLNNGDGSLPIEHCIERWKRLIDDVTSSSSVHRLMGLHSIVEEACQA